MTRTAHNVRVYADDQTWRAIRIAAAAAGESISEVASRLLAAWAPDSWEATQPRPPAVAPPAQTTIDGPDVPHPPPLASDDPATPHLDHNRRPREPEILHVLTMARTALTEQELAQELNVKPARLVLVLRRMQHKGKVEQLDDATWAPAGPESETRR